MATVNSTAVQNASFKSAHSALVSAFQVSGVEYERAEKSRLSPTPTGPDEVLISPDSIAQPGMIRAQVRALGPLVDAALVARIAPKTFICECGAPTCLGYKTNREWFDAITELSDYVGGAVTNAELRTLYVERHFTLSGLRESLDDIAATGGINRQTAEQQFSQVSRLLDEIESSARGAITSALVTAGMVAGQMDDGAVYH